MRVLVSGASGLIGSALVDSLKRDGHKVLTLVREHPDVSQGRIGWDPYAGILGIEDVGVLDAVVHLAGAGIAEKRWTPERKALIRDSRVRGTKMLAEIFSLLPEKPKTFLCASAIGYYGSREDEILDETSSYGTGFLAEVCREWEAATENAAHWGIRVVNLRSGVVLSPKAGILKHMLPPFRLGLGAVLGSGRQWMSWITLQDEVAAIRCLLEDEAFTGAVNLTTPNPVTNREFSWGLGQTLRRPMYFQVPAWGVKALLGEMGQELLLSGQRVIPSKLLAAGFKFSSPTLEEALRSTLGREP